MEIQLAVIAHFTFFVGSIVCVCVWLPIESARRQQKHTHTYIKCIKKRNYPTKALLKFRSTFCLRIINNFTHLCVSVSLLFVIFGTVLVYLVFVIVIVVLVVVTMDIFVQEYLYVQYKHPTTTTKKKNWILKLNEQTTICLHPNYSARQLHRTYLIVQCKYSTRKRRHNTHTHLQ